MAKYKQGTLANQRVSAKILDKFWFCRSKSRVNDGIFANSSVVTIFFYIGVSIKGSSLFSRVPSNCFYKNVWPFKCGIFKHYSLISGNYDLRYSTSAQRLEQYRDTPRLLKTDLPGELRGISCFQLISFHKHNVFFYMSYAFANRASFSPRPEIEKEHERTLSFSISTIQGTLTVDESLPHCKKIIGNPIIQVIQIKESRNIFAVCLIISA